MPPLSFQVVVSPSRESPSDVSSPSAQLPQQQLPPHGASASGIVDLGQSQRQTPKTKTPRGILRATTMQPSAIPKVLVVDVSPPLPDPLQATFTSLNSSDTELISLTASPRVARDNGRDSTKAPNRTMTLGSLGLGSTTRSQSFLSRISFGGSEFSMNEAEDEVDSADGPFSKSSLFLFSQTNRFRVFLYRLVEWTVFRGFILAVIAFNCVVLAMNVPGASQVCCICLA